MPPTVLGIGLTGASRAGCSTAGRLLWQQGRRRLREPEAIDPGRAWSYCRFNVRVRRPAPLLGAPDFSGGDGTATFSDNQTGCIDLALVAALRLVKEPELLPEPDDGDP